MGIKTYLRRLQESLVDMTAVRHQVVFYTCITSINTSLGNHYRRLYGQQTEQDNCLLRFEDKHRRDFKLYDERNQPNDCLAASLERLDEHHRASSAQSKRNQLEWRDFPGEPRWLFLFRVFTTCWMAYMVVRYLALNHLVSKQTQAETKLHCYMMGRYILHDSLAEITGFVFAASHLIWRIVNMTGRSYKMSVIYFLLLSGNDLSLIYSSLDGSQSIKLMLSESQDLRPKERFLLETMCFRVDRPTGVVFKLRSNRTRESHLRLRRALARLTIILAAATLAVASVLTPVFTLVISLDSTYLAHYPDCDPELQQLASACKLSRWSVTFNRHHVIAGIVDGLETAAMWVEAALVVLGAPGFLCLVNWDLMLQWRSIDRKITTLLQVAKRWNCLITCSRGRSFLNQLDALQVAIRELHLEINDFYEQVGDVDRLLSIIIVVVVVAWLLLCAGYAYMTRGQSVQMHLVVKLTMLTLLAAIMGLCYGCFLLHRLCSKSYTTLCSLMAHDPGKQRDSYSSTIDSFVKQRSCYRTVSDQPFVPTSFLKFVGWTLSCIAIISRTFQTTAA
jgi:hypothetical protein